MKDRKFLHGGQFIVDFKLWQTEKGNTAIETDVDFTGIPAPQPMIVFFVLYNAMIKSAMNVEQFFQTTNSCPPKLDDAREFMGKILAFDKYHNLEGVIVKREPK